METRFGGEAQFLCGMGPMDLRPMEKRTLEWDLNDWKWDGDLFIATQLNEVPSDELTQKGFFPVCGPQVPPSGGSSSNCSSSCSVDVNLGIEKGKREVEKRRRVTTSLNNGEEQGSNLSLKLGGGGGGGDRYGVNERELGSGWEEETSGKKTKLVGGVSSRSGACQVQDCGADLSTAKDYHRRHKVCEIHSKASKALVGNVLQRFCQQCSRFHALQEFDEGRRSCRRRLAGHNQRRRKTNPDPVVDKSPSPDDQNSGYLLMSLLKILSNMHSNGSNQTTDQDMLSHLVRSLACQTSDQGGRNISGFLQESPNFLTNRNSIGVSELASKFLSNGPQVCPSRLTGDYPPGPSSETPEQGGIMGSDKSKGRDVEITSLKPSISNSPPSYTENRETAAGQSKVINFDLNDIYVDSDDGMEDMGRLSPPENLGTSSLECPSWVQQDSHQSSPPQTSGNSESVFAPSPSSSNGEAQSRTGRIVFKLFGKEPNDFPLVLRSQIFDWLSNSPSDIESYIRPGCVILTIYLRQTESAWDKLCYDLSASLNRLLQVSDDAFWKTGWVYIRLEHQIAFVNHGQVVIDTSLPLRGDSYGRIVSVKPIAVSASESARFSVRGSNLIRPATRLLCALEGKYLAQTSIQESKESLESSREQNDIQCVSFSCSIPIINGRGFIEVEDQGLSSSFIPFIVAEEDVCSEIRLLETAFEPTEIDSVNSESSRKPEVRNQAMNFIHEMGWLLHRTQLKSRPGDLGPNPDLFPLERFKWLVAFSMDRDWHAVVKKLLDVLLDGRAVGFGDYPSLRFALSEMGLLHRAVRRSSRPLVGLLIGYNSKAFFDTLESEEESDPGFLFRPDAKGPAGLTPLHIAAGKDGSEEIIDALTDDPAKVGLEAWKSARDSTGSTPEDYARLRGHYSYIHLVQKKINQRTTSSGQVILDIPRILSENSTNLKSDVNDQLTTEFKAGSFELNCPVRQNCGLCARKVGAHQGVGRSLVYRPAMLSMVAVAAVCVCVALLFKSSPEVLYVFQPFRWESLEFGTS